MKTAIHWAPLFSNFDSAFGFSFIPFPVSIKYCVLHAQKQLQLERKNPPQSMYRSHFEAHDQTFIRAEPTCLPASLWTVTDFGTRSTAVAAATYETQTRPIRSSTDIERNTNFFFLLSLREREIRPIDVFHVLFPKEETLVSLDFFFARWNDSKGHRY